MKGKSEKIVKIWNLYDSGLNPKQIAKELKISINTVKKYIEQCIDYKFDNRHE